MKNEIKRDSIVDLLSFLFCTLHEKVVNMSQQDQESSGMIDLMKEKVANLSPLGPR